MRNHNHINNHKQLKPIAEKSQKGVGLVELMIAMLLGLFLIGGVIQIFVGSRASYRVTEGMSRLQENARYVMSSIAREISSGGFYGCVQLTDDSVTNTLTMQSALYDFASPVDGSDGTTDSFTIRRAVAKGSIAVVEPMSDQTSDIKLDDADADYAALQRYQVLAVGDCARSAVFMITNDPSSSSGVIQHRTGVTAPDPGLNANQSNATTDLEHVFGAETNSVATVFQTSSSTFDVSGGVLRLNGDSLVEGVSNMQVEYGLPSGVNTQYITASSVTDWSLIESIRVTLLFNTVQAVTTDNQLIEREYTTTFRIRNRAPEKS